MNNPVKKATSDGKKAENLTDGKDKKNAVQDIGNLLYTDLLPVNRNGQEETSEFLQRVVNIMVDFLKESHDRSTKVLDFHHPDQLKEILDLDIPDKPLSIDQLLVDCKETLKYQVKTAHPHYFNQLSCGIDMVCLAGEWVTAAANTNMFTYEIAPVFTLMEQVTMKKMRDVVGFKNGDSILAPGGSISNLYAGLVARHKMFPNCKKEGTNSLPQLVMFTSRHSHYSINGAGMVMGIGMENVIEVDTDDKGRMMPTALEKCVQEAKSKGFYPFFVTATAGSTVVGAYDPINPIADICDKYGMWLHIDAAWGGGCLLSKKYKSRMAGVERGKSLTWNPHKQMGALLQCSTLHLAEDGCVVKTERSYCSISSPTSLIIGRTTQNNPLLAKSKILFFFFQGLLFSCNQLSADYLFQQDKPYDVTFDTGDKVIQCGRHNDIFKLWLMWRSKPECTNVCYWYVPPSLQKLPDGPERRDKLGESQHNVDPVAELF
ncbi:Glutamate decarboxylase [Nymphon striatum]|nr:Glutamate decarboxylase [Nymphon striatum]